MYSGAQLLICELTYFLLLPVSSIYHDLKMTGSEGFKRKVDDLQKGNA